MRLSARGVGDGSSAADQHASRRSPADKHAAYRSAADHHPSGRSAANQHPSGRSAADQHASRRSAGGLRAPYDHSAGAGCERIAGSADSAKNVETKLAARRLCAHHPAGRKAGKIGASDDPIGQPAARRILPIHRSANRPGLPCSSHLRRAEPAAQDRRVGSEEITGRPRAARWRRGKGPADGRNQLPCGRGSMRRDSDAWLNGGLAIVGGLRSGNRMAGQQPEHSSHGEHPIQSFHGDKIIPFRPLRKWGENLTGTASGMAEKGRAGSPLPAAARTECAPYHARRTQYPDRPIIILRNARSCKRA